MEQLNKQINRNIVTNQSFDNEILNAVTPHKAEITISENGLSRSIHVVRLGVGDLKTDYGDFLQYDFSMNDQWGKYSVLVKCSALNENWMPVFNSKKLLMRIDSGCETGQLFGDNTCECKEQLHKAMEMIAERGEGVIIHIPRQDGRGMGLPFKLATLTIQSRLGYDTVRAARYLKELISRKLSNVVSSKIGINCNDDIFDIRTYCGVVATLKYFEVPTTILQLATNNPEKTRLLYENGYTIEELIPVKIQPNEHTKHHLAAKQKFLGHLNLL